jgi:hypothetical protein
MIATTPVITTNEFACISHLHNRRFGEGWWGEGYSTSLVAHSVADRLSHHTNETYLGASLFFRLYGWRGHLRGYTIGLLCGRPGMLCCSPFLLRYTF